MGYKSELPEEELRALKLGKKKTALIVIFDVCL